jgi:hypothetical protein
MPLSQGRLFAVPDLRIQIEQKVTKETKNSEFGEVSACFSNRPRARAPSAAVETVLTFRWFVHPPNSAGLFPFVSFVAFCSKSCLLTSCLQQAGDALKRRVHRRTEPKTRSPAVGSFAQIRPRCQVADRRRLFNQAPISEDVPSFLPPGSPLVRSSLFGFSADDSTVMPAAVSAVPRELPYRFASVQK